MPRKTLVVYVISMAVIFGFEYNFEMLFCRFNVSLVIFLSDDVYRFAIITESADCVQCGPTKDLLFILDLFAIDFDQFS